MYRRVLDETGYVAGGYFLTRPASRGDAYMATGLVPPTLITLSGCLADFAFDYWWNEQNVVTAAEFGVDERRLPELIDWYVERFGDDLGAPNVAYSTAVIEDFVREFVDDSEGLVIVGCAVSTEHRGQLLERHRAADDSGEYGVIEMLDRNERLDPGADVHGFEPMSYEYGLECSWLCNSLERSAEAALGIRPDPRTGLVSTYGDAVRVVEHINRDDIGAEPGTWLPWLIATYALT